MTLNLFAAALVVLLAVAATIGIVRAMTTTGTKFEHEQVSNTTLIRRTSIAAILTAITLILSAAHLFTHAIPQWLTSEWTKALLITPVMFLSGYSIHIDGWKAWHARRPDLQTLASLGTSAAYAYSLIVCFTGDQLPEQLRSTYFEFVGVTITLVLAAQITERLWLPANPKFPLQQVVNRIAQLLVPIVLIIATWTFVIWLMLSPQPAFVRALVTAISVLTIACPCAFAWVITLPMTFAVHRATQAGLDAQNLLSWHNCEAHCAHNDVPQRGEEAEHVIEDSQKSSAVPSEVLQHSKVNDEHNSAIEQLKKRLLHVITANIAFAVLFAIVTIPIAAGVLYPLIGWSFNPVLASMAMIVPCIGVALISLTLKLPLPRR
ncbi:copper-exporting ATPase [Bifidobacterium dolichotidis]|uniref:Copper-exporting ATPase n=1 Tax=Bifidobacterium dolichotidis TaxID=2306976 RepID=A0A430FRF8_9BIFI|nr:hypothetical protein [Bifidobacterium dolichotidis]RSX55456.1 copper-exporting ATPase [Bifidobacterium dolichotidis]